MKSRRDLLLGMVAGVAGVSVVSSRAFAWHFEELTPGQTAALAAACRPSADNHAALLKSTRDDLLARIAKGLLPAGATEQVGCPMCGCNFIVSADGAL